MGVKVKKILQWMSNVVDVKVKRSGCEGQKDIAVDVKRSGCEGQT